jgi:ATP-binding cassette, subfamily B, bacterial
MQKDIGLKEIIHFIKTTLRPYYKYVSVMFFSGVVWAIDLSLRPYLFKVILNIVAETPPEAISQIILFPVLYYLGILTLLSFSYRLYDFFIEVRMMPEWTAHIIKTGFSGVMHNNYTFFQKTLSGSISARINDLAESVPNLFQILIDKFITRIFGISIVLFTLYTVNTIFLLITAIWLFMFVILSFFTGIKGRELSNKRFMQSAYMTGSMVDVFSNISTVWFFSATNYEKTRFNNGIQKVVAFVQQVELLRFFAWLFFGISFIALQALSLYFLVQQRSQNLITVGDFSLILTLNLSLANFIWDLARDFSQFAKHLGRITQSLSTLYETSDIVDVSDAKPLIVTGGTIKFEDVNFYFRGEAPLFQHKTVTIPAGQKVGLVGSSGSGKTTFVNLILRLYDVKSGKILIDDQDIRSVTLQSLRDSIIVVQQESALFHRSIKENIAYGMSEEITMKDIIEAAKKAQIHDMIIRLPHGYDTVIGQEGFKPSGGERQRLGIARGHMKKNAKIVILDEITSQLDLKNEASILQNLLNLIEGKTTIIIAHRLSTLLYVDRILVFHQGKIVQDGTHEELLSKEGFYKSLWDMQKESFLLHESDE